MSEQPQESQLDKILKSRLESTLEQIKEIERQIPELQKDYDAKMQELNSCKEKIRINVLRTLLREKRLFIKQQQEARLELVKQIQLILKMREEGD